ncbi:hypothetical protein [Xanthomonas sp. XNM01]|uniref:hypothetical protein n=1 Tax=Xanthomonas sp. XNM01 TaxID=2769289 RepID=UPI001782E0A2|nr:hypothetical protein [Xanthomonas sp. XNM01]MBD9370346.1 hypothetical protein [Xanthomonas sp. XNM01]
MSKLTIITDRALELAGQAGTGLRHAGASLRGAGHDAEKWLKAGAALGAARTGAKVATTMVRRNPVAVAAAAAVVGAGVLAYFVYRKRREQVNAQGEPIEGQARKVTSTRRAPARSRSRRSAASE